MEAHVQLSRSRDRISGSSKSLSYVDVSVSKPDNPGSILSISSYSSSQSLTLSGECIPPHLCICVTP